MEKRKITLRPATQLDVVNIFRLHLESHKEARGTHNLPYPPVSENKCVAWMSRVITSGYVLVADLDGRVIGSVGLEPEQLPWSEAWHIRNGWLDVLPAFRKHGTADSLMAAAERFVDERGAALFLNLISGVAAEVKDRWVKRRGYTYAGGNFFRPPRSAQAAEQVMVAAAEAAAQNVRAH